MKRGNVYFKIAIVFIAIFGMAFMPVEKITIKGSDTMVILSQKWAELYMKKNPNVTIQVTGGGSGTGISALINGTTDIANASRKMKQTELEKMKEKFKTTGVEIACAKDAITIFLNKSNTVKELSIDQLSKIFSGKITNWKEVGGKDIAIILYGRENSSGTYEFFKEEVVKTDYAPGCQTLPGTAAIVNAVKKDPNSIGYGGAAYAEGVVHCKVKKDDKSASVEPNEVNIKNHTYPISRYLYMYVANKPTGAMKAYIDWILSADGQKVISEVGYFPLK